jgi:hypothetical protein
MEFKVMTGTEVGLCHCYVVVTPQFLYLRGKRGERMYQIYALLGLMCFTWGAAIYASYAGGSLPRPFPPTV